MIIARFFEHNNIHEMRIEISFEIETSVANKYPKKIVLTRCCNDIGVSRQTALVARQIEGPKHASQIYCRKAHSFFGKHASKVFVGSLENGKASHKGERSTGKTQGKFLWFHGQHGNSHKHGERKEKGRQEQQCAKDLKMTKKIPKREGKKKKRIASMR